MHSTGLTAERLQGVYLVVAAPRLALHACRLDGAAVIAHPATTNTISLILFCLVIAALGSIPLLQVGGHRAACSGRPTIAWLHNSWPTGELHLFTVILDQGG
jgi:hypothetical protein